MKYSELKKINKEDLNKKLKELEFELLKNSAQAARGGGGKEASRIKVIKKDIARLKTLLNRR